MQEEHQRKLAKDKEARSLLPLRLLRRLWSYLARLQDHGILVQAIGVPLRHVLAVYGLVRCFQGVVGWRTYLLAFLMWPFSGLGVTAGAHRLWSHQSYTATPPMQVLLMIMFSCADQGSIQGWALTHAMHHSASDTKWDPHNRQEGFWHAHFGWLFSVKQFRLAASEWHRVNNGLGDTVKFHDRVHTYWDPLWSLCFPAFLAWFWGEAANGLFIAGALRWLFVQHVTFFVNSMGHGPQEGIVHAFDPMAKGIGARVSVLTTILALGEGWHDYHHLFPWDYAAAELSAWDQWNPTKVFIDACLAMGLAQNPRRCSDTLQTARRRQLLRQAGARACGVTFSVRGVPFLRYRVPSGSLGEEELNEGDVGSKRQPSGDCDSMTDALFPPASGVEEEEEEEDEPSGCEKEENNVNDDELSNYCLYTDPDGTMAKLSPPLTHNIQAI